MASRAAASNTGPSLHSGSAEETATAGGLAPDSRSPGRHRVSDPITPTVSQDRNAVWMQVYQKLSYMKQEPLCQTKISFILMSEGNELSIEASTAPFRDQALRDGDFWVLISKSLALCKHDRPTDRNDSTDSHASVASISAVREGALVEETTERRTGVRWLGAGVVEQQSGDAVRGQGQGHVAYGGAVVAVRPHVIDGVLPSRADGPALGQVEEHLLGGVLGVQDHEHDAVAGVAGPVLRGEAGVGDVVRVDAPAERVNGLADVGVLVDHDEVFVAEDLDRLVGCVGQVRADDQVGLEERPGREVAFGFFVGEITGG